MLDLTAMRSAASLTPAVGSLKPDHRRKLRPVDGIKPFVLGADRHRAFLILRELIRGKSLDYTVRDIEHASDVPSRLAPIAAAYRFVLLGSVALVCLTRNSGPARS
jgi:hypothetical protein